MGPSLQKIGSVVAVDDLVKLVDSMTKLLGVLVWPTLLVFVLVKFSSAFKDFFASLGELTLKGAGFEATAKRKQEAAAALVAASVSRPAPEGTPRTAAMEVRDAATAVEQVDRRTLRKASSAWALWVDDRPDNNIYERQSLEALGVRFVLAKSTDDALAKIASQRFDVVISDMGRPPDPVAGYTLLERLRAQGDGTPFVIYASSNAADDKAEALRRGAVGSTNKASELFRVVLAALGREA
jgi:CheY-like chemotaxis protein